MRRGNIIAGFLLTPFLTMSALLIGQRAPSHPGDSGAFVIVFIFGVFLYLGSYLYLIARIGAWLETSVPIRFINRYINVFRAILLVLGVLVALSLAFASKKPIPPTKEVQTSPWSLRV